MTPTGSSLVVGLLGGIGSGKSAAAAAFARRGAIVITADELGHQALRDPAIRAEIVNKWGPQVVNGRGEVDRPSLAKVVFADPKSRKELEAITHPWIRRRAEEIIGQAREKQTPLIILDAAVLLEAGWESVCDQLLFIESSSKTRYNRVLDNRGWTLEELLRREDAQLPLTNKRAKADHIIVNDSTLDDLNQRVDDLMRRWGKMPELSRVLEAPPS